MFKKITIIAILCFSLTLTACNSVMENVSSDDEGKNQLKTLVTEDQYNEQVSEENMLLEKNNTYVELYNFIVDRYFTEIMDPYIELFGVDEFVEPESAPYVNVVVQHELDLIDLALQYSQEKPAIEGFDETIQIFVPTLKKLIKVMNEASAYYNQKNYVDDNYAKASEYHLQILDTYINEFLPSYEKFTTYVEELGNARREETMQTLKENDMMIHYSMIDILCKAEEIQNELFTQDISSINLLDLDLQPIKEKYSALIESINSLREYSKDESRLEIENISSTQTEQYTNYAGEVKASVTEMIQRVENQEAVDDFDIKHNFLESVNGSPEKFHSKVYSLIDYYNMSMVQ